MSNVYSLAQLCEDLDKEFAPLKLEVDGEELVLRNLMRIHDSDRSAVLTALTDIDIANGDDDQKELSAEQVDAMSAALRVIFSKVTANGKGDKLVEHIDQDLMLSMKILELWTEATQPGEAQSSPA